jgi:hypothetical protein
MKIYGLICIFFEKIRNDELLELAKEVHTKWSLRMNLVCSFNALLK